METGGEVCSQMQPREKHPVDERKKVKIKVKGPFMSIKAEFNGHRALSPKIKSEEAPNLRIIMERKAKHCLRRSGISFTLKAHFSSCS